MGDTDPGLGDDDSGAERVKLGNEDGRFSDASSPRATPSRSDVGSAAESAHEEELDVGVIDCSQEGEAAEAVGPKRNEESVQGRKRKRKREKEGAGYQQAQHEGQVVRERETPFSLVSMLTATDSLCWSSMSIFQAAHC